MLRYRGRGTGEAGEARASPEFRGFTAEKFFASWKYEGGSFSCFTGKKLVQRPLSLENRNELILDVGAYPKRWKQLLSWMINLLGECFFIIRVTTNIYYVLYVCLWRTTFPSLKGPLRFTLFSIFPGLYYTKMDFSMSSFLLFISQLSIFYRREYDCRYVLFYFELWML